MTTSEQARADAMADAETLRLHWEHRTVSLEEQSPYNAAVTAMLWEPDPAHRGWLACLVAHAAFRAVPGLRG